MAPGRAPSATALRRRPTSVGAPPCSSAAAATRGTAHQRGAAVRRAPSAVQAGIDRCARERSGELPAVPLARAEEELGAISGLHERKVEALLATRNRLQCENAQMRQNELDHRRAGGRGAAFARAERELARQDAMIRKLYTELSKEAGKESARALVLATLDAGPKRSRATTREELRWQIEDARLKQESLEKALLTYASPPHASAVTQPSPGAAQVSAEPRARVEELHQQVEGAKRRLALREWEVTERRVEADSLELVLHQGREFIETATASNPFLSRAGRHAGSRVKQLEEGLRAQDEDLMRLHASRVQLENKLQEADKEYEEVQCSHERTLRSLLLLRERTSTAARDASVASQAQLINAKKRQQAFQDEIDRTHAKMKELRSDKIGGFAAHTRRTLTIQEQARQRLEAVLRQVRAEAKSREEAFESEKDVAAKDLKTAGERTSADLRRVRSEHDACRTATENQKRELAALRASEQAESQACKREDAEVAAKRRNEEELAERQAKFQDERIDLQVSLDALHARVDDTQRKLRELKSVIAKQLNEARSDLRTKHVLPPSAWRGDTPGLVELRAQVVEERKRAAGRVAAARRKVELEQQALSSEASRLKELRTVLEAGVDSESTSGAAEAEQLELAAQCAGDDAEDTHRHVMELEEMCLAAEHERAQLRRSVKMAARLLGGVHPSSGTGGIRCAACGRCRTTATSSPSPGLGQSMAGATPA